MASACVNCKKAHLACDGTTSPHLVLSFYGFLFQISFSTPPIMPTLSRFSMNASCMSAAAARRRPIFSDFYSKIPITLFPCVFTFLFVFPGVGPLFRQVRRPGGGQRGPVSGTG